MTEQRTDGQISANDKRKYLFLRQVDTLDGFLKTGAISRAQYDFSYQGLVTKMNITDGELEAWLSEYRKVKVEGGCEK